MTNFQKIHLHLNKVLNSQCFSMSVVVKELFKYLVEKTIDGEAPKEMEILYEVFGNSQNQTKEKNIRIYVHNLRKKLDEYYQKEGAGDEIIFALPKGAYQVKIIRNKRMIFRSQIAKLTPYILGLSLVFFLLATLVISSKDRSLQTRSYIWKDIYKSKYPLLIILGDHYFFNVKNVSGSMATTRIAEINSDDDFNELLKANPEVSDSFVKSELTYISKQVPLGLFSIMSFLGGGHNDINIRYSSNLKWEHLHATNAIYFGSYKTQYVLRQIFEKIGITFNVTDSKLVYTVNDSTSIYDSKNNGFLYVEYATLVHFKTKDERIVMALLCNSDIGNIATIKYLSQPKNLRELKSLTSNFQSENYKVVFEVRGENQTDFRTILKRIDPVTMNMDEIWP